MAIGFPAYHEETARFRGASRAGAAPGLGGRLRRHRLDVASGGTLATDRLGPASMVAIIVFWANE